MNFLMSLFLLSFTSLSVAQTVSLEGQSYANFQLTKLKSAPSNSLLISWGNSWMQKDKIQESFFAELENFSSQSILTTADRSYLLDLIEALINKAATKERERLRRISCQWAALSERNYDFCKFKMTELKEFRNRVPFAEILVAEDMGLDLKENYHLNIDNQAVYNWRILSSTHQPISFRGSFQELQNQNLKSEALVQGSCDSFNHRIDDIEVISRGQVDFPEGCRRALNKPETSGMAQWYEKNKSWAIPVGIALLGAVAYQMKDKKIIFHRE